MDRESWEDDEMAEKKAVKTQTKKKKLVIVESPTKVDSVKKYLGRG